MKRQRTVDIWQCDLLTEGTPCSKTYDKELPKCVACGKHVCPQHREMVRATIVKPHSATLTIEHHVCHDCSREMSNIIESYWPAAVNMMIEECAGHCREAEKP